MNRFLLRISLCLLLIGADRSSAWAQESGIPGNSSEVHRLFTADQADREAWEKGGATLAGSVSVEAFTKISDRDKQRRERTRQIIDAGGLKTAQDYHDAAFIFQHGDAPEDYLLAHILATAAITKGDLGSRWIAAATLDRYLQFIKQKQVFGTQYMQSGSDPFTQEPFDRKLLNDDLRRAFCVKARADLEKTLESLNQHLPAQSSNACLSDTGEEKEQRIGSIEFFGYAGLDLKAVQAALPIRVGDSFLPADWPAEKEQIKQAVTHVTGHEPTNTALVCCNPDGNYYLFIGLQGKSSKAFAYNPAPTGSIRLPTEALDLYDQAMAALSDAVARGDNGEDDSQGYMLANDPKERALDLKMREYALHHEDLIRQVLKSSSDVHSREVASDLLGYAQQSQGQIDNLVAASRDPDWGVRNNATRALSVLADSSPEVAAKIPATSFVEMLNSGDWTDRNKSLALLTTLTTPRSAQLLAQLRSQALDSLVEMARWRAIYAIEPRIILARIAGMSDQRLDDLTAFDPAETIIGAIQGK